jgi:phosphatidylglycerophosphatase A
VIIHLGLVWAGVINGERPLVWAAVLAVVFAAGVASSRRCEKLWGPDDRKIVIDEIWGMMLSLFLLPAGFVYIAAAFLIFRFLDIVKPFPARRLEDLGGGWGVMLDDGMSGVYTCLILHALRLFAG